MNLYLLVEGTRTEKAVYPAWLKLIFPGLRQVFDPYLATDGCFYLFSSNGYPGVRNDVVAALRDIGDVTTEARRAGGAAGAGGGGAAYRYLVVCLDSDDDDVESKRQEILAAGGGEGERRGVRVRVVVQRRCIESWFMGNRARYPNAPSKEFAAFARFYDVSARDPELMRKPSWFATSNSQFHALYIKKMLQETGLRYSKKDPRAVCSRSYLEQLARRTNGTPHLRSLQYFFDLCREIAGEMERERAEGGGAL